MFNFIKKLLGENIFSDAGGNEKMMDKQPCKKCGKMILPVTLEKTGGYCMPCKEIVNAPKACYQCGVGIAPTKKGLCPACEQKIKNVVMTSNRDMTANRLNVSTPKTSGFVSASLIQCHLRLLEKKITSGDLVLECAQAGKEDGAITVLQKDFTGIVDGIIPGFKSLSGYYSCIEKTDSAEKAVSLIADSFDEKKYLIIVFPSKFQIDQDLFDMLIVLVIAVHSVKEKQVISIPDGNVADTLSKMIQIRQK